MCIRDSRERHPAPSGDRVRVLPFVPRLVQGEETAEGEQDDRHDEGVEVPGPAVAERALLGRGVLRPAADEHPFGYGRARYFYAFIVSVVLFTFGGLFALY